MSIASGIQVLVEQGLAVVRLNRPQVRNAITLARWEAAETIFERFGADQDVRAVVLTGDGAFTSHGGSAGAQCATVDLRCHADPQRTFARQS